MSKFVDLKWPKGQGNHEIRKKKGGVEARNGLLNPEMHKRHMLLKRAMDGGGILLLAMPLCASPARSQSEWLG